MPLPPRKQDNQLIRAARAARPTYILAAMAQIRGQQHKGFSRCNRCVYNGNIFQHCKTFTCFNSGREFGGSCCGCYFDGYGSQCSFRKKALIYTSAQLQVKTTPKSRVGQRGEEEEEEGEEKGEEEASYKHMIKAHPPPDEESKEDSDAYQIPPKKRGYKQDQGYIRFKTCIHKAGSEIDTRRSFFGRYPSSSTGGLDVGCRHLNQLNHSVDVGSDNESTKSGDITREMQGSLEYEREEILEEIIGKTGSGEWLGMDREVISGFYTGFMQFT
jgi:hypothetical protein